MTEKLYYADCHQKQFTARVVQCRAGEGGYWVTLDRTAFYPTGGGQPCDLGRLGLAQVLDVQEREGEVIHLCSCPLTPGQTVEGILDWDRRFALMQQHSGEHIVSGLVHARFGYHNVGFHMGADCITIDFDGEIPPEALEALEDQANRAVYQDLPLHIWTPTPEELPTVPYRRKRDLPWPVRVVEIPGVDLCACCGVHVARTGEIGPIKLLSCVKFHQGVRMELVCGSQAMAYLTEIFRQNQQVSRAFSAKPLATGEAARRMNEELAAAKFRAGQLENQLFDLAAEAKRGAGDTLLFYPGLNPDGVRRLTVKLMEVCGGLGAVFSGAGDRGYFYALGKTGADVKDLTRKLNQALNGRGGGKNGFAQGSVSATEAQIRAFFQDVGETL